MSSVRPVINERAQRRLQRIQELSETGEFAQARVELRELFVEPQEGTLLIETSADGTARSVSVHA
ncbi:MAG: hypothetical protein ACYTGL_27575, partial [Planctomycetota bacterium]